MASTLSRDELEAFFLEKYAPTPMFNPWGARSGFFPGGSETSSRASLEKIKSSANERFADFRCAITTIERVLKNQQADSVKPDDKKASRQLVRNIRNQVRGNGLDWLDSVMTITAPIDTALDDVERIVSPALFGTGGSDGSGSFVAAYMSAVVSTLIDKQWSKQISTSLFGGVMQDNQWKQSPGQFLPFGVLNPWDFMLAFEGAICVKSSVVKTSVSSMNTKSSIPFAVSTFACGSPSTSEADATHQNKGQKSVGRGEQWFPVWESPCRLSEVKKIFLDGRISAKKVSATNAVDAASAIANQGTAIGVKKFLRYVYTQRNNVATYFAVQLGSFDVPSHADAIVSCVQDFDRWLKQLYRHLIDAKNREPNRLNKPVLELATKLLAHVKTPTPQSAISILLCCAGIEAIQASGTGFSAGPIPKLRPEWIDATNDGSAEFRLALAFAAQAAEFPRLKSPQHPVREHFQTLNNFGGFATSSERLAPLPQAVVNQRSPADDCIAIVNRRLVDRSKLGLDGFPLQAKNTFSASTSDLAILLCGGLDLERIMQLARSFCALDFSKAKLLLRVANTSKFPDDAWMVIRLSLLPWPLIEGKQIPPDPAIARRLSAGDAAGAFALERVADVCQLAAPATVGSALPTQRGYGIFDLAASNSAHLRFSPFRAQWVAAEIWHTAQVDTLLPNGGLERQFPYGNATELVRDLMREGADVEVLAPIELRLAVLAGHRKALESQVVR